VPPKTLPAERGNRKLHLFNEMLRDTVSTNTKRCKRIEIITWSQLSSQPLLTKWMTVLTRRDLGRQC